MECFAINLPLAWERREAIDSEFRKVGLDYELWPATEAFKISPEQQQAVDRITRRRRGFGELDASSHACLLSHLGIFQRLVDSNEAMAAVFEDDARLHPDLPEVLAAIEGNAGKFDVIKLQRTPVIPRPYYPVYELVEGYTFGRVRYAEFGAYGYVITKDAAAHLLERFPRPVFEIDWIMPRFWENGLDRVFYLNRPVVFHDDMLPSYIEGTRRVARTAHRSRLTHNPLIKVWQMLVSACRALVRWYRFRALRRGDRNSYVAI